MAKANITVQSTGLKELIAALQHLPEKLEKAVDEGTREMAQQAKRDAQSSYLSMVKGATTGDYVYRSIDQYATFAKDGKIPWLSAGSFEYVAGVGDLRAAFGKTSKDMGAPQVAYWIENGTMRLVSGARKPKNVEWSMVDAVDKRQAIAPTPFLSNAATSGWNRQEQAFAVGFNKIMGG